MAKEIEVRVPDIGDFEDVEVIEVLVAKGDQVAYDDPLVSIESDKATMELPAPSAGEIVSVEVSVGDRVSEGTLLARLRVSGEAEAPSPPATRAGAPEAEPAPPSEAPVGQASASATGAASAPASASRPAPAESASPETIESRESSSEEELDADDETGLLPGERVHRAPPVTPAPQAPRGLRSHASPLVRGMARELGVELAEAQASGPSGRVLVEDLKAHVRERMSSGGGRGPADEAMPVIDFSRFGPVEEVALAKIRRVAATHLSRAWRQVPHVTQHDEADVTALEAFRKQIAPRAKEAGVRVSPLAFAMKAVVQVLRRFPDFRSSLAPDGESLIVKNYYHLGIAVDTENGLIVPVVRDVDRKGIFELAGELAETAERARNRKLAPADLQGAVFSISSLGGIGGTHFTPIVNAPEVAILGLSRQGVRPVWDAASEEGQGAFVPRTVLPLSLSYDHRVIDGAAAARFTSELVRVLSDPVQLLL